MEKGINRNRIIASLFWKFMERGGVQAIQFVIQIILARLLVPEDYGVIALISVFISVASVFIESGFGTALVQKKEVEEVDLSSVFYLSLSVALFLYILLFFTAPLIASFYQVPLIIPVFRVLSINLVFGSINSVQNAIVSRNLHFKLLFFRSVGGLLISGTIGIIMAYKGYGVWALVGQSVLNQFFITIILWFTLRWRPRLSFSFSRVKEMFSFSWKLLVASLSSTLYRDFRSLVIGKMYQPIMLGYYNRGQQFPSLIVKNIDESIQTVMFPVLASQQDDKTKVKRMMRRSILTSSFIVFPLMVGLAVIAKPLVLLLLTEKWLPAVPYVRLFCAIYALYPIHSANLQAIKGLGYSGTYLRLNLIRRFSGIVVLLITATFGVYAITLGQVLNGVIASIINAFPNKQLLNYSYKEQLSDIMPFFAISAVMGAAVYGLNWLGLQPLSTVLLQVGVGVIIYTALSAILKVESFSYLFSLLFDIFHDKVKK